jgi:hypothetical protein
MSKKWLKHKPLHTSDLAFDKHVVSVHWNTPRGAIGRSLAPISAQPDGPAPKIKIYGEQS